MTEGLTDVLLRCTYICMNVRGRKRRIVCSCRSTAFTTADTHNQQSPMQTNLLSACHKQEKGSWHSRKRERSEGSYRHSYRWQRVSQGSGRSLQGTAYSGDYRIRTVMARGSCGSERVPSWKNNEKYWNIPSINWCPFRLIKHLLNR